MNTNEKTEELRRLNENEKKTRTNKEESNSNYITSLIVRNEDTSKVFRFFLHVNRNNTSVESNNKKLLKNRYI